MLIFKHTSDTKRNEKQAKNLKNKKNFNKMKSKHRAMRTKFLLCEATGL